jgi:hypothetical protein
MLRLVNLLYKFFMFLGCNIGSTIVPWVVVDDFHTLDFGWLPCVAIDDSFMEAFITGAFFPQRCRVLCPRLQRMDKCTIFSNYTERR